MRLNSDGSIDDTFNLSQIISSGQDTGPKFALFSDGKLMIATSNFVGPNQSISVLKLTAGGERDTSFNPTINNQWQNLYIEDVAIQPDGKIIVAGSYRTGEPGGGRSFVGRLNADGSTDSTFIYSEELNQLKMTPFAASER